MTPVKIQMDSLSFEREHYSPARQATVRLFANERQVTGALSTNSGRKFESALVEDTSIICGMVAACIVAFGAQQSSAPVAMARGDAKQLRRRPALTI